MGNKPSAGKKKKRKKKDNGYILHEAESYNRVVRCCINIFWQIQYENFRKHEKGATESISGLSYKGYWIIKYILLSQALKSSFYSGREQ